MDAKLKMRLDAGRELAELRDSLLAAVKAQKAKRDADSNRIHALELFAIEAGAWMQQASVRITRLESSLADLTP